MTRRFGRHVIICSSRVPSGSQNGPRNKLKTNEKKELNERYTATLVKTHTLFVRFKMTIRSIRRRPLGNGGGNIEVEYGQRAHRTVLSFFSSQHRIIHFSNKCRESTVLLKMRFWSTKDFGRTPSS